MSSRTANKRRRGPGTILLLALCGLTATESLGQWRNPYTLYYEQPRGQAGQYHFEEREHLRIRPEPSDFRLEEYTLMSNDLGERWALVTFRNTSTSNRLLKNEHLVATLADGGRVHALNLNERLDGGQLFTQAVFFGVWKFPILFLEMGGEGGYK